MRNAEYKGRVESRNETRAAIPHSAFRIPHLGGVVKVLLAGGGTGGHLMPALALAQALQDAGKGIEPVLVGAVRGIEAQVLPRYPFRHRLLPIEPIYRRTWWKNVRWLLIAGRVWRAVGRVLDEERRLLDGVNVLWGTGMEHADALARYAAPGRVVIRGFFDPMTIPYRAADLVLARAGAMTVAELCAWGKPSILVPLPSAAADHQAHNARALAEAGAAPPAPPIWQP